MTNTTSPLAARIYGVAAMAAPLLLMASTIAYIVAGEGINHGVLGGVIGVWACFALVIAFAGILRHLEVRAPRAAPILTAFALTGFSAGIAFNVVAIFTAVAGPHARDYLDVAVEADPVAILGFLPWGLFTPLSLLLVGLALWRTRTFPAWNGALLALGGVLFVAARPERINVLALIADGVLVTALVPIGWAMLRHARPAAATPPANRSVPSPAH
ncbi:MAG: hypothetical protein GEU97_19505 [Actinophytocola sp.]|nr:hypothetical protein [Actinophytocola sp.]